MLVIILVLSFEFAMAQDNYIEHAIQKGESVYKISKQYGVTINSIFELNPGSETVIYAGRTLRVPKKSTSSNTATNNSTVSSNGVNNYVVQRGETKSGLSRRFGVSIAQLEQQNPQIIPMLQAGHVINVDKSIAANANVAKQGEHIVVKGETLWGIARNNGISVAQLEAANSGQLSEYLQIGQRLIIPDKNSKITNQGEYIVQRGDTKFQLSRRFNMTIAELENKNPQIIPMLMAGHILNVDNSRPNRTDEIANTKSVEETENQTATTAQQGYEDYIIQPQETLYGLARKAGMSIDDFTTLNPKLLTSVNKGDVIKMPISGTQTSTNATVVDNDSQDNAIEVGINPNNALMNNLVTDTASGLYFYTPFSSEELSSPELRDRMVSSNSDLQKHIDFFQGAQIAIDSAKALNLNFDVTLIKKNIAKSQLSINSPHKKNAILVPFLNNSSNYPKVKSNEEIAIIDIESNLNPQDSHKIYRTLPSDDFQKSKALNYLSNLNGRVIVVSDLEETKNKNLILEIIPEAKFLNVDSAGFFESNALENALSTNKTNYVILDSEKTIVFLKSTTTLMSKLSEYNIQLVMLKSSLIPNQGQVSDMRYRVLKLIFPTIIDPRNKKGVNNFTSNYVNIFGSNPSKDSQLGFDITLDILLRLAQSASFENTADSIISDHPHLRFEYKQGSDASYLNTGVRLMQYHSNEGIMELD